MNTTPDPATQAWLDDFAAEPLPALDRLLMGKVWLGGYAAAEISDALPQFLPTALHDKLDAALLDWLRGHKVEEVDICGIATDYCVRATALDAAKAGFRTTVLTDLCAGVAPETTEKALSEFAQASITAHAITGR